MHLTRREKFSGWPLWSAIDAKKSGKSDSLPFSQQANSLRDHGKASDSRFNLQSLVNKTKPDVTQCWTTVSLIQSRHLRLTVWRNFRLWNTSEVCLARHRTVLRTLWNILISNRTLVPTIEPLDLSQNVHLESWISKMILSLVIISSWIFNFPDERSVTGLEVR